MSQSAPLNRRIVLNARPRGAPTGADFRIESDPVPTPEAGQVLLRTLYLSLDPYMRGRMSDEPSYAALVAIGDLMVGGTVSRVEASRHGDFKVGDLVLGYTGWQDYAVSDGKGLTARDPGDPHPSLARRPGVKEGPRTWPEYGCEPDGTCHAWQGARKPCDQSCGRP